MVVASKSAVTFLSEIWAKTFPEAGFAYHVYHFGGECSIAEIERIKAEANLPQSRVIIGAGGAKTLDTARAVASRPQPRRSELSNNRFERCALQRGKAMNREGRPYLIEVATARYGHGAESVWCTSMAVQPPASRDLM